ncbi:MAG: aminotransferase class IV [Verrucomicrobiota bacterium]|nr:aminotransferase class IV [Verrucomicrobiota bacterium]
MLAFLNGIYIQEERAQISVFDRGYQFGDGVFETMRIYHSKYFLREAHLRRLYAGLDTLGIPMRFALEDLVRVTKDLVLKNHVIHGFARVVVSRGRSDFGLGTARQMVPTVLVVAKNREVLTPLEYEVGFRVIIAQRVFAANQGLNEFKTINYLPNIIAKREAEKAGVEDALLANTSGEIIEGTASNVFFVKQGTLVCPPDLAGLNGITRQTILEIAEKNEVPIQKRPITAEELYSSDEVFLTSSVQEIRGVVSVDQRPIGECKVGPLTRQFEVWYKESVKAGLKD